MHFRKYIFYLFYTCISFSLLAQRSEVKIAQGTFRYYIHTIKKGETLSQLALLYDVNVKNIKEANPDLVDLEKIKSDQKILIPNFSDFRDKYPSKSWDFILYKVGEKEKLKSIAKKFNIDTDDLKIVNPGVENKPKVGVEILIPQKVYYAEKGDNKQSLVDAKEKEYKIPEVKEENLLKIKEEVKESDCKNFKYNPQSNVFNIALALPFNLDGAKSDQSIYFLEGALLAVEDLKNEGLVFDFNVYDVATNKSLNATMGSEKFKTSDLIIGPFAFSSSILKSLADFAKSNEKPFVSPYNSKGREAALDNPYYIQIYPSDEDQFQKFVGNISKDANPILVYSEKPDSILLKEYESALKGKFGKFKKCIHTMGQHANSTELYKLLSKDHKNVIFICSDHQIFVSDLLDRIRNYSRTFQLSVYGRPSWGSFKRIDPARYFDSNLHLVQPFYVDFNKSEVKNFIYKYRLSYNNEPVSPYSYLGYDITYGFLTILKKYGPHFIDCLSGYTQTLLQTNLLFKQINPDGGYINTESFLLEFTPDIEIVGN